MTRNETMVLLGLIMMTTGFLLLVGVMVARLGPGAAPVTVSRTTAAIVPRSEKDRVEDEARALVWMMNAAATKVRADAQGGK